MKGREGAIIGERGLFDIVDLFRVGAYSGEGTYLSVYTYSREILYEDLSCWPKEILQDFTTNMPGKLNCSQISRHANKILGRPLLLVT